ncbi:MAG: polysaccharide deacetylase family protein [Polyangiaceae bacterium]
MTSAEPTGVHVPLDAKVIVRFDRDVAPEGVTLTIDPPVPGKVSWTDARTFVFAPARWHDGKMHHLRIEGPGIAPHPFEWVSMSPPPDRVEPGGGKRITLTFDDGATRPALVATLLDLLKKEQIEAIFFPTGQWAEAHPRLIERMSAEGHRVCNHTYSHPNLKLPSLSDDAVRSEIRRGAGAGSCELFRPPMRAVDARVERIVAELGYTLYLWDVDRRDWEGLPAEDIVNRVLRRAQPGAVVLFHMHAEETLKALPPLVARLRKAGYTFRDPADAGAPDAAAPLDGGAD